MSITPEQSKAALEAAAAAAEGTSGQLSSAEARRIVRAYLRGLGYAEDAWGNFKIDATTRYNFGDTVLRKQSKSTRGWYNLSSRSLISAATSLLQEAGKVLGKTEATERATKIRAKRVKAKERSVSKKQHDEAAKMASKELAWKHRAAVLKNLTREPLPEEQLATLKQQYKELTDFYEGFIFKAGREPGDDSAYASIEKPPHLPVFGETNYFWAEKIDGVDYSIEVSHAAKHVARVQVGESGTFMRVDPITGGSRMENPDAVGDGGLYGSIAYVEHKGFFAKMYLLIAQAKQKGAGTRLLKAWCSMMRGYGITAWVAEAVGEEGNAFLEAMHKRGVIEILKRTGSNVLVACR